MARVSRKNITSKYIHVITQGLKKEYIFEKNEYKAEYIKLIRKFIGECESTKIVAYCIMSNHAHLLIYTENIAELSKIMSRVNTAYAIFYNNINDRVGYVFKNRFYVQQIKDEGHLYNAIVYIHKNPVKAGIVENESVYNYSSFNDYVNSKIDSEIINKIFGTRNYLEQFYFMHKNFSEENIKDVMEEDEKSDLKIKKIITEFCDSYNYNLNDIKNDNYLLILLIKKIKGQCYATNKMISEYIGIGKNRITNLMKNKKTK